MEQKAKEGRVWEVIEGEKAKQRRQDAVKKTNEDLLHYENKRGEENFPQPYYSENVIKRAPQTRDNVAKRIGFGSGIKTELAYNLGYTTFSDCLQLAVKQAQRVFFLHSKDFFMDSISFPLIAASFSLNRGLKDSTLMAQFCAGSLFPD